MADAAICQLTGQSDPDQVPVRINLLMTDRMLFGIDVDETPAQVVERGVGAFDLPAELARRLAASAARTAVAWVRRIYAHPVSGQLLAMEARTRQAPTGLADFVTLRDQTCRTRYCDAAVRHLDHVEPVAGGGTTSAVNLQGLCEQCNHAKQAPGWTQAAALAPDGTHQVETVTAAGQRTLTGSRSALTRIA